MMFKKHILFIVFSAMLANHLATHCSQDHNVNSSRYRYFAEQLSKFASTDTEMRLRRNAQEEDCITHEDISLIWEKSELPGNDHIIWKAMQENNILYPDSRKDSKIPLLINLKNAQKMAESIKLAVTLNDSLPSSSKRRKQ